MASMDRDSPALSPRLLDVFFALSAALTVSVVVTPGRPAAAQLAGVGAVVALIALWAIWRRTGAGWATVAFAAGALVTYVISDSVMAFPLQWVALILLELSLRRAVGGTYAVVLIGVTVSIHLTTGSGIGRAVSEGLAVLLLVIAGMSFAVAIKRASTLDSERRAALLRLERKLVDSRDLALSQERARMSSALHDGLGHRLTTIGLSLDFAQRVMDSDPGRAREEIAEARRSTSAALADMRATVRAMTPVELESGGVRSALSSLAASFTGTGLSVNFTTDDPSPTLGEEAELFLLRATQETLTNTIRHSDADTVDIRLTESSLTIADNGGATTTAEGDGEDGGGGGYGLRSLRQRAERIGATFRTDPDHGGFVVHIDFPGAVR